MDSEISSAAMEVALFCRLNMNRKTNISIRYSELGILIYIATAKDPVCPVAISSFFGISKPSISSVVKILIKNGYAERLPSEMDRRSYTLHATPAGRQVVKRACNEYTKEIEILRGGLGQEDFGRLIRLIEAANRILKEQSKK